MNTDEQNKDPTKQTPKVYLNADPLQSKQLLNVHEVGYCLNRSRASVYVLMARGQLVGIRHLGKRLFHSEEVQSYINNLTGKASAA